MPRRSYPRDMGKRPKSRARERRLEVYVVRNVQTGAVYIGVSRNAKRRFKQHLGEVKKGHPGCSRIVREAGLGMLFELTVIHRLGFFDALIQEKREICNARSLGLVVYNQTDGGDYPMSRAEATLLRQKESRGGRIPTSKSILSKRLNEMRKKIRKAKPVIESPKVFPIPMRQRPFQEEADE